MTGVQTCALPIWLLQAARVNELYPKDRRDAIIIFCLDKGYSLTEVECELYRFGEATIC